ncbi:MAG: DUF4499 domain-containing protein [Actinobacteria bacterium]|nr:DUF4499 domain-containing protein [Actinomycetota bacterium]
MIKRLKAVMLFLGVAHFIEASAAAFIATKKGKNPIVCFGKTLFMGVFFLILLIRK